MDNSNELYDQIYLFFKKENSTKLIYHYMRFGMNLIFNSDSLIITTKNNSYKITIIQIRKKKYWNINSKLYSNKILCKDGNMNDLLEFIYNNDYE